MPTNTQLAAIRLYADTMEEIKVRIEAINSGLNGETRLVGPIVHELCFLQLRMICELIALACLTAHGDIEATTKLKKEWSADRIINEMEKLHQNFYPSPRIAEIGIGRVHFADVNDGYLTKKEFIELVRICGNKLHKGSLKKLLTATSPVVSNFPEIAEWTSKIIRLLQVHLMLLQDQKTTIFCILKNQTDNDRVQVGIAEAP